MKMYFGALSVQVRTHEERFQGLYRHLGYYIYSLYIYMYIKFYNYSGT